MRHVIVGLGVLVMVLAGGTVRSAFECPTRIAEARSAVEKAAAKAAARGPLTKAKDMLSHAEAEHQGAGTDVKKHAEAVREARTARGYAEEARLIAGKF